MLMFKKTHDRVVSAMAAKIAGWTKDLEAMKAEVAKVATERDEARQGLEVYRSMALNRGKTIEAMRDELAHWRANGQLRDPNTGRLIPRAKTEAA